jgi:hypothetical protein
VLHIFTLFIWINEGSKSLFTTKYKNELLAVIGFLIASVGTIRSGLLAAMTSQAG